eukprot:5629960-Lingulodinium_polyedra.AAC.1
MMSTKWPLTVLLIELLEETRAQSFPLALGWIPREENTEADSHTNQDCSDFCPALEIKVVPSALEWR